MDNNTIHSQLEANAKALEWGRVYLKGQELEDFRDNLITNRIKLKRLLYASGFNPAAAIFGESQVGKSYMVDCLLTSDTDVLNIYDGENNPTGFLESINPNGGGKEATSLISRFSTEKVWIDKDYPVRASMLSPIDVVIVLADTYYNDVTKHDMPKAEAIKEEIARLKRQYQSLPDAQNYITEDEIYELRDYLRSDLVERCELFRTDLIDNKYFEELALIINKVNVSQWTDVFSFLWNRQPTITDVFSQLIGTLERMSFSRVTYIKMDAVLRDPGTILHVDRMYELFGIEEMKNDKGETIIIEKAKVPTMDVLTADGKKLSNISKSEFCALATELAFTIADNRPEKAQDLKNFHAKKPFLAYCDILDFPGARSRLKKEANIITKEDACNMVIRGKVAYLFNKYSQQYLITNLLFCHHDTKSEVVTLSALLKGWVNNTVGTTPEKRSEFMRTAEVSPLFVIGTKFNIDLEKTAIEKRSASEASKKENKTYRWSKRFGNLMNLINPSVNNDWFTDWTPGRAFDNVYLLRSYEYSCTSNIFEGYMLQSSNVNEKGETEVVWKFRRDADGKLLGEERISDEYNGFIRDMKESFMEYQFAKDHFASPEKSWDEAASVGHDGSAWIIENLTRSARNTRASRDKQFGTTSKDVFEKLIKTVAEHYYDDNSDMELAKQIRSAGEIALSFDALFGKDKYFFSDFISAMLIGEEDLHDVVLDVINNLEIVDQTDLSMLFAVRAHANIDNNLPFDENVARLIHAYSCDTQQDLEEMLAKQGISIEDVINPPKVMNFSRLIANAVEKVWIESRLNIDNYKEFVDRGLDEKQLKTLLDNIKALYLDKIKLSDRIATRIHPFVSSAVQIDDLTDMLADISAEMINKFVNTMGSAYFSESLWADVSNTLSRNNFDVKLPKGIDGNVDFDDEAIRNNLPLVLETFDNVDQILNEVPVDHAKLERFSNYIEFYKWRELMRVSFLATCGIPKYDINMNNAIRTVIIENIMHADGLQPLVSANAILNKLTSLKEQQ